MKSRFWKIQLHEKDKYKMTFIVPFRHYEWNVMTFGLKNAHSEFQNIMTDIFNPYTNSSIVHIDDVIIFSNFIKHHFKHLNIFQNIVKENGLVVSTPKIKLFQTKIRFLGYEIYQGKIKPIQRSVEFASKVPNEIKYKPNFKGFWGVLIVLNSTQTLEPLSNPCNLGLDKIPSLGHRNTQK